MYACMRACASSRMQLQELLQTLVVMLPSTVGSTASVVGFSNKLLMHSAMLKQSYAIAAKDN